jgi:hypothetical protein
MKMKQMRILTIIMITCLTACAQIKTRSVDDKKTIDLTTVDNIKIKNQSVQEDTLPILIKQLTSQQIKIFVDKWNNAKSMGPSIFVALFMIDITFVNGSKRTFRINGQSIKENNDWCFDLGDSKYIEQLWNETE